MNSLIICLVILVLGYVLSVTFFRKHYHRKMKNAHNAYLNMFTFPEHNPKLWQMYLKNSIIELGPYLLIILGYFAYQINIYLIILLIILILNFGIFILLLKDRKYL